MIEHYLPEIAAPTLVISGDKDLMTPLRGSRVLAERIPNAELVVIPDGTHFALYEFPEVVNEALERFLGRVYPESALSRPD